MSIHKNAEETNYWISIGDMMAAILAIFIFFFLSQIMSFNLNIRSLSNERTQYKSMIKEIDSERIQYKLIVQELDETRIKIIQKIKENIKINIDENTGSISLPSEVLFESGRSELKSQGKEFLNHFIPIYMKVLLGDAEIRKNLSQIVIEGHTDKQGSYLYNLDLSQKRALAVAVYVLSNEMVNFEGKDILDEYITANGRSYSDFLGAPDQEKDEKSRRVEFKFVLKEADILDRLRNSLLINESREQRK